jgi:hypothetical protein
MKKFELGRVLITPGAKAKMERTGVDEIELLCSHRGGYQNQDYTLLPNV